MTETLADPTGIAVLAEPDIAVTPAEWLGDLAPTPIDEYLRRQQELTPVERFARAHDADHGLGGARWWQDRIPVQPPVAGQQYAFEVELDSCTGCKACVTACHSLNGLDDGEQWRQVGSLHGATALGDPITQTITTACHHCVDPACLAGCPVDAYEKDAITGIVHHLDDQCIGCSYCTLTCPYEVPVFNRDLGIVRKCDLCSDRLAEGEAPACVQGCPNGAMRVRVVDIAELRRAVDDAFVETSEPSRLVPGAPISALTIPSTTYRSKEPLPSDLVAADAHSVQPAHAHTPLVVMLVLTQLAVGTYLIGQLVAAFGHDTGVAVPALALAAGALAIGASILHLGRPLLAWRAVIGLRHSWLSREIVAFGAFGALAALHAICVLAGAPPVVNVFAEVATGAAGLAGVGCSVAIYVVTGRSWWTAPTTAWRFANTTVVTGGLAVVLVLASMNGTDDRAATRTAIVLAAAVVLASAVALAMQYSWTHPGRHADTERQATASLLAVPLARAMAWRRTLSVAGGIVGPALAIVMLASESSSRLAISIVVVLSLLLAIGGELVERRLFFMASKPPRMPGVL